MLYDPKWEVTTTDPFKLESLIAWLERQPVDEGYEYNCSGRCLLAQYFTAQGFRNVHMFVDSFWHGKRKCPGNVGQEEAKRLGRATPLPRGFNIIAINGERTFGAALERARADILG